MVVTEVPCGQATTLPGVCANLVSLVALHLSCEPYGLMQWMARRMVLTGVRLRVKSVSSVFPNYPVS